MRFPPGPCARSRRARSPASRRWRRSWRSVRRYTGTTTPTTSAPPPRICFPTTRGTSPGRRCTWTPGTTLWGCSDPDQPQPDAVLLARHLDQPVDVDGDEVPPFRPQLGTSATVDRHVCPERRGCEVELQPAAAVDPERRVGLAHVPAYRGGLGEPALAEDGAGARRLDALRCDAAVAALEEPHRPGGALNPPTVRQQAARGEPARARHCRVVHVEPAVQRDRADAEALELTRQVAAPVAAVEPLETVGDRLRRPRGGRRVAAGPLTSRCGVVPEVDAAVMDARIEDGQLEQASPRRWHRSRRIARRRLAVDACVQVDEEQSDGKRDDNPAPALCHGVREKGRDAQ